MRVAVRLEEIASRFPPGSPGAGLNRAHRLVPISSCAAPMPELHPAAPDESCIGHQASSSSGEGRYAVDAGRYRYALRSDSRPPTMGTIRRKYRACAHARSGPEVPTLQGRRLGRPGRITRAASPKHAPMSTTLRSAKPLTAPSTEASREREVQRVGPNQRAPRCAPWRACPRPCRRPRRAVPARPSTRHRSPVPHPRSTTRAPGSRCSSRPLDGATLRRARASSRRFTSS